MSVQAAAAVAPSAVLHGRGDLRVEGLPPAALLPGTARIRLTAVGVCGSDTHYYRHGRIGEFVLDGPLVLGHEPAGVVTEVAGDVAGLVLGDRVALEPGRACGTCDRCLAGQYNVCPAMAFMATPPHDGAFSTEIVWDARLAHPLPDAVSDEQGALCEPLSVGVWACERAGVGLGDEVLVSGAGAVGLLAAQVARARGATRVVVRDLAEHRLALARSHGLETELVGTEPAVASRAGENGAEFTVLLECSGAPGALGMGLGRLRSRGRAVMIGLPAEEPVLPLAQLHHRELQVQTIFRYANTWPTAIDLLASGRVRTDGLVTHRFDLQDVDKALMVATTEPGAVKAMVLPSEGEVR
ncbi:NAD(P)-dependent alcohol dehydrogenase [Demequina sp. SYSU T00192]|uniref:NAD(P)-dependent alcohol dehydrogenase n=1 Tax=Demequina litoralis TaxID=3051660 RepID=A0ABT8G6L0_9MICO|nr:NAD(P)-dependent alcohol dehydrogenase [Demequina sp. SYSU T00192]MDN4474775.1 NAD(P)-dependent alcohol dehydrogenase [Demequina sp. SYSU T00192]